MNRKGVEGLAFRMLISIFIVSVFSVLMVNLLNSFFYSRDVNNFYRSVGEFQAEVDGLKFSSDEGSFITKSVLIPKDYSIIFHNSSIDVSNLTSSFSIPVNANFLRKYEFNSGGYELRLCYGFCEEKDFVVIFS